jgi:hypothetical protein
VAQRKRLRLENFGQLSEDFLIMETHLMYDGKKYEVLGHREYNNGSLSVDLKPVPKLPPEPPVGTILVDDDDIPWRHLPGGGWDSHLTRFRVDPTGLTWEQLLRRSALRPVVIVPKGKSAVVFNGGFDDRAGDNNFHSRATPPYAGDHYYRGYSDMEAPVHGYFEQVTDA